jgi:WD40 repeat protein
MATTHAPAHPPPARARVHPPPARTRVQVGHKDSIITLTVSPHFPSVVASGSEDGDIRVWDLAPPSPLTAAAEAAAASRQPPRLLAALAAPCDGPVTALAFDPRDPTRLYAGCLIRVLEFALQPAATGGGASSPPGDDGVWGGGGADAAAAGGAGVSSSATSALPPLSLVPGARIQTNRDEIAALAAHDSLPLLAAADDDGDIAIVDTQKRSLLRVLRKGHTSLCGSVAFRPTLRPPPSSSSTHSAWRAFLPSLLSPPSAGRTASADTPAEIASGGFDHTVVCWNAKKGVPRSAVSVAGAIAEVLAGPPTQQMQDEADAAAAADEGAKGKGKKGGSKGKGKGKAGGGGTPKAASSSSAAAPAPAAAAQGSQEAAPAADAPEDAAPPQSLNPPFVHSVAFSPGGGAYVVAGLGDGTVAVLEWDEDGGGARPPPPVWWAHGAHASAATCVGFARHDSGADGLVEGAGEGGGESAGSPPLPPSSSWVLYSAGNDGFINLWRWEEVEEAARTRPGRPVVSPPSPSEGEAAAAAAAAGVPPRPVLPQALPRPFQRIRHGRGPNWMAAATVPRGGGDRVGGVLVVGDTRKDASAYVL